MTDIPDGVAIETVWLVEVPYTPEAPTLRPAHRPVHLERIARLMREGVVVEAGGGQDWSKAVLLIRAASAETALALIEEDVYTREGVWHQATARAFGRVVLEPSREAHPRSMSPEARAHLDAERTAWRPFEALAMLPDETLSTPLEAAHGWAPRDLMGHMLSGHDIALRVARELADSETSPTKAAADADWDARGAEVVNAELQARWAILPLDELRRRFADLPSAVRCALAAVPETRWLEDPDTLEFLTSETIDHYADHLDDLSAILASAG